MAAPGAIRTFAAGSALRGYPDASAVCSGPRTVIGPDAGSGRSVGRLGVETGHEPSYGLGMGELKETRATLGFYGDDLDPDEITARLSTQPTVGVRKGGTWKTSLGAEKVAPTGSWRLEASDRRPGDLDTQIGELLGAVTDDQDAWRELTSRYRAVLFCGLFLGEGNEGVSLKPETLTAVGARGLLLDLDIYGTETSE
jgi:hypothetical protein